MKRSTLLAGLAATVALSACNASPTLPAASAGHTSASAAAAGTESPPTTVDINDPSRPMFGGSIGNP
jgi:ABC-type glycerol-3-phosphate transport system substrate-binding protein